jgi:putative protease
MPEIEGKLIGKVTHYFDKIKVMIVELTESLKSGDTIRTIGGESTDFEQKVGSMEVDHKKIKQGKKGESVGLEAEEKVREGYKVYKI